MDFLISGPISRKFNSIKLLEVGLLMVNCLIIKMISKGVGLMEKTGILMGAKIKRLLLCIMCMFRGSSLIPMKTMESFNWLFRSRC